MRNRARLIVLALASTVTGVNKSPIPSVLQENKRFSSLNNRYRMTSAAVCSLFAFSSLAPAIAAPPPVKTVIDSPADKDVFKDILNTMTGSVGQTVFAKQFQEFATANAPVTISTRKLYKAVGSLPGNTPFRPVMLDAVNMSPDTKLPPGDYLIPVRVYCMQHSGSSPNGHRYVLGKLGGKRREIVTDLHTAAARSRYSHDEIQGVSWYIQSGRRYHDMPSDMKPIVEKLIPQHRQKLDQSDFIDQVATIWNTSAAPLHLPSLGSFLQQQGNLGKTVLSIMALRQGTIQAGSDWRNLGRTFVLPDNGTGNQEIGKTPWSEVQEGVYARFVTPGNYKGVGLWEFRIGQSAKARSSASPGSPQGQGTRQLRQNDDKPHHRSTQPTSAFPSLNIWNPDGSFTVPGLHSKQVKDLKEVTTVLKFLLLADVLGIMGTSVAVPEKKDNNQPLQPAPTPLADFLQNWNDLFQRLWDAIPNIPDDVRRQLRAVANPDVVRTAKYCSAIGLGTRTATLALAGGGTATSEVGVGLAALALAGICAGAKAATLPSTLNNESSNGTGNSQNSQNDESITRPSEKPGGKPRGEKEPINPQSSQETQRGLRRQHESADILADKGYNVEQLKPRPEGKNPDFNIEGRSFDNYAPSTSKLDSIRDAISRKVKSGQTDRIILNLNDSNANLDSLRNIFTRKPVTGLKEIISIKGNQVIPLFP